MAKGEDWTLPFIYMYHAQDTMGPKYPIAPTAIRLRAPLPGELHSIDMLRRPSTIFKDFFSKTHWPIDVKFHLEPQWDGGMKVCLLGLGHMTETAAMPIYDKKKPSKIFFSRTKGQISLWLDM